MEVGISTRIENCLQRIKEVTSSLKQIPFDDWSFESVQNYCARHSVAVTKEQFDQYFNANKKMLEFDSTKLFSNLKKYEIWLENLLKDAKDWNDFNVQYQTYVQETIKSIDNAITILHSNKPTTPQRAGSFFTVLENQLIQLAQSFENSSIELYEHFKYGNKNYIIFGKNGAGKTTLLRKISTEVLNKNSYVIPADRSVTYNTEQYITMRRSFSLNQKLSDKQPLDYLYQDINVKSLNQYESGVNATNVIRSKLYSIFNKLGLEREIVSDNDRINLSTGGQEGNYDLNNGSDGERTVVYMIMAVLLLPDNSFVFIDEPENHLNGALMRKLFDELEDERSDVRFVYLTHNTDFIETRRNYELIYLEKSKAYMTWNFHEVTDFSEVPIDVILGIEGTKDDILFCEGENKKSIDFRILKALFPEMEIVPVASCEKVISNTNGLNGKQSVFRRNAFGIIDKDYRTAIEITALNEKRVNVLPYNEWENLLLIPEIITELNQELFKKDISIIKNVLINTIRDRKQAILTDYLNKRCLRIMNVTKLHYGENLCGEIEKINETNKNQIIKEVEELAKKIDTLVQNTDYEGLVDIISGKMLLGELCNQMGCKDQADYVGKFIDLIYTKNEFKELVKGKVALNLGQ